MATNFPQLRSYVSGYLFNRIELDFPIALLHRHFDRDPHLNPVIKEIDALLQYLREYEAEHNPPRGVTFVMEDGFVVTEFGDEESEDEDYNDRYVLVNPNRDYDYERGLLANLNDGIRSLINGEVIDVVIALHAGGFPRSK